ncbi:sulfatase [Puteibacter caeruleilacunae]|nr:sulfatase [Puteibacter caeruleilacunae]
MINNITHTMNLLSKKSLIVPAALMMLSAGNAFAKKNNPNIVIIMADDLGYADLSCYGSKKINTPNIDRLAAEGVKFSDFHSNGAVCSPTRAALLTGKYQQRTGITGVVTAASHRDVGLDLAEVTFADMMKQAGYVTGMFGKWHVGYPEKYNPVYQGFDEYIGYVSGNVDYHAHIDQEGYEDWWKQNKLQKETGYSTDLISKHAVDFIKRHKDEPFLLYIPHESPHGPMQGRNTPAFREIGKKKVDVKRSREENLVILKEMIEVMDEGIGNVMRTLEDLNLDDNTLIFFCSDNGGAKYADNTPLRAGKGSAYEGGHRVAGIFKWKGKIKPSTTDNTALTMDVLPTIADIIGVDAPKGIDGVSLKNLLFKGKDLNDRDLFWQMNNKMAMRSGNWKLVYYPNDKKAELYDLGSDIGEKNNLAEKQPQRTKEMTEKLQAWYKEVTKDAKKKS